MSGEQQVLRDTEDWAEQLLRALKSGAEHAGTAGMRTVTIGSTIVEL